MSTNQQTVAVVGVGSMGSAIIKGLTNTKQFEIIGENPVNPRVTKLSQELGFKVKRSVLYGDNAAAIKRTNNTESTKRSKHIQKHFHFIRDEVLKGSSKWSLLRPASRSLTASQNL